MKPRAVSVYLDDQRYQMHDINSIHFVDFVATHTKFVETFSVIHSVGYMGCAGLSISFVLARLGDRSTFGRGIE